MGTNLPNNRLEMIQWFETRLPIWTANAATIGLTADEVTALGTLVTAARTAYDDAQSARSTSKAATAGYYSAVSSMREVGAEMIAKIKVFAEQNNDPEVYETAEVSAPDPRSPAPPPNQPTDVRWSLTTTGMASLTWKASGNFSTYYEIFRKLEGQTSFTLIGTTGEKSFVDGAIPTGTPSAVYYIRPRRDANIGPTSTQITASFNPSSDESGGLALAA